GGKRTRAKRSKNSDDSDENCCPNTSKRKKCEDLPEKAKEAKVDLDQLALGHEASKELAMSEMGLNEIVEDDTYVTSDETPSQSDDTPTKSFQYLEQGRKNSASPTLGMLVTPEHQTADFFISRRRHVEGRNHFSRLSDEILLMIFRWLPKPTLCKVALVSKQWRQIAYDDTLWSRLDLGKRTLMPRNLEYVLKRGVSILRLAGTQIPDTVVKPKSTYLPQNFVSKLQYLDLSMAQITTTGLFELLHTCRQLRKLSLENCKLDQRVCEAVGHNASLEALNLSSCEGLTANGLEAILACCTSLLSLNLAWTCMNAETLETLTTTLPKSVQRLSVAGCRKNLTNEHVKKIVQACPNLVEFDVSDCTVITATAVNNIMALLASLEHLSLSRCYGILPTDFERLNDSISLIYADIFGVLNESNLNTVRSSLPGVFINKFMFSSIARPTVGVRRTSIWGLRVRD
ncbi:hypothetical protein B566_EDAN009712, partial [Ephemera danica]